MKNLLALVCLNQTLVPNNNEGINLIYHIYTKNPRQLNYGIPLLFPVLQLLVGLQCNDDSGVNEFSLKEFFAFEMAREIGIFDDLNGYDAIKIVEQKKMAFTFLYLSILLVIERDLFNFDGYKFIEQQIFFSLKNSVSN